MPKGIYERTENSKNTLGKHWKIKDTSKMHHSAWNKDKIGIQVVSEETRKKMRESAKKVVHYPMKETTKKKLSDLRLGKKQSPEMIEKRRLGMLGHIVSPAAREKIGKANSGLKRTEKQKQANRERRIQNPLKIFKDTSIELKVEAELKRRGINYQKQVPLCKVAIVDFYLPEFRVIIQCDGDYWHNLPGSRERSERQDKVLTFNGFNIYHFWEHEINKSVEECINILKISDI